MFATIGAALQAAGYTVTPCRGKAPFLNGWQKKGSFDSLSFAKHAAFNVGLVLGVAPWYVVALDIDSADADFAEWCEERARALLGCAPVRVGKYPKRLMLYRLSGPHAKAKRGALEVLCTGQQCVAYGTHPDTGGEYEWTDLLGGLTEWAPGELVEVEWSAVAAWLAECSREAQRRGLEVDGAGQVPRGMDRGTAAGNEGETGDPMQDYVPVLGLSIDEARGLLEFAGDPAVLDYDEWLRVGMALHHEGGGGAEWKALWDAWCCDSPKFVQETGDAKWESFGKRSGRPVTLKWLVALRNEARRAAGGGGYARTEAGNARRLVDRWGRDLLWCPELGCWYRWNGAWWRAVTRTEVLQLARDVVDAMRDEVADCDSDKEKADLLKWCAASQRWTMYDHMVSIASLEPTLWVRAGEMDSRWYLLGVPNGAVDLRTGELRPPAREDRITRVAAVPYDANARCPLFEQQVNEVHGGDPEMVSAYRRIMGYTVMGKPVEDVLVINHGNGNNGKSTTNQPIVDTLGDHATTAAAALFLNDNPAANAGSARPDLLALSGRRLVFVNEPDQDGVLREGLVKSMTGGENIPARALWSTTVVQMKPTWVVVMSTNHKPVIKGDDKGIWRRLLPVPWDQDFDAPGANKDVDRVAKLETEKPGILAWLVRGALEYQRSGLALPGRIDTARREYRGEMDLLADWLRERCVVGNNESASLDTLWVDWEQWARVRGELRYVASRKALSKRLQNRGFSREYAKGGTVFFGVKLRETAISDV